MNVNTRIYWENRFATGEWEEKRGREQTRQFAETQIKYLKITSDFSGSILDFGCGLGDAMPVYHAAYPRASLMGIDISEAAITKCKERYGSFAQFIQGDYSVVQDVNVIIASNIFEHLSDDIRVAAHLLTKCHDLFIITPYRETLIPGTEHINSYNDDYFRALGPYDYTVFSSKGWRSHGWHLWLNQYPKNILRPFLGKQIVRRKKQIMFHFANGTHTPGG